MKVESIVFIAFIWLNGHIWTRLSPTVSDGVSCFRLPSRRGGSSPPFRERTARKRDLWRRRRRYRKLFRNFEKFSSKIAIKTDLKIGVKIFPRNLAPWKAKKCKEIAQIFETPIILRKNSPQGAGSIPYFGPRGFDPMFRNGNRSRESLIWILLRCWKLIFGHRIFLQFYLTIWP